MLHFKRYFIDAMLTLLTTSERVLELDGEVRVGAILDLKLSYSV